MHRIESFAKSLNMLYFYNYFKIRKNCAAVHILYTPSLLAHAYPTRVEYIYLYIYVTLE